MIRAEAIPTMSAPQEKSALHVLAFLYLVFSHTTDANLGEDELKTISGILKKWVPDAPEAAVNRVFLETVGWYNSIPEDAERYAEAKRSAHMMREHMSDTQRGSVLLNLIEIARADGEISAKEDTFIAEITDIFNMSETRKA
jgi:uncharacterized tellurite resistance protein B-like protein